MSESPLPLASTPPVYLEPEGSKKLSCRASDCPTLKGLSRFLPHARLLRGLFVWRFLCGRAAFLRGCAAGDRQQHLAFRRPLAFGRRTIYPFEEWSPNLHVQALLQGNFVCSVPKLRVLF
jgi:hypothetical protein